MSQHRRRTDSGDRRLLADPDDYRANCGVGVVANLGGESGHDVLADGLELLENLEHRGTTGAEENTGDGAGMVLETPHDLFAAELPVALPAPGEYAVGTVFLPRDFEPRTTLEALAEDVLADAGLDLFHWRDVPTENGGLGKTALDSEPAIRQCFVRPADDDFDSETFDRRLYVARRELERAVEERESGSERFYVCSLDRDTVVYKGLLKGDQLASYYPDLTDPRVRARFVMVHARFSTNTLGAWHLAHPFRNVVHNGEFNTIRGNVNWMRAREGDLRTEAFDAERVTPVVTDPEGSDTAAVDDTLELLLQAGRDLPHALRLLVPEAWRDDDRMADDRRDFYDFHASLVEPWDGPALVAATDGDSIGAVLDRNGLRPCRYDVTADDRLVMASEAGALDTPEDEIVERGRLEPGQLFLADLGEGRIVPDSEVFEGLADEKYGEWVEAERVELETSGDSGGETGAERRSDDGSAPLRARQAAFGYTRDELDELLGPMATAGKDPVGSMGDDTPLSVLSEYDRPLFSYFKQLFAQVSNPPIDYLREDCVTSLESRLGRQRNLLSESPAHARQLVLDSPVLTDAEVATLTDCDLPTATVDLTYPAEGEGDLEAAVAGGRRGARGAGAAAAPLGWAWAPRARAPPPTPPRAAPNFWCSRTAARAKSASRCRACSPPARSTTTSSARGCGPTPDSSWSRATPARSTTSPASSATAPAR